MPIRQCVYTSRININQSPAPLCSLGRLSQRPLVLLNNVPVPISGQQLHSQTPPKYPDQRSKDALLWSLKSVGGLRQQQNGARHVSTASSHGPVQNVAVLGGGITGLASAYYLSELSPQAKITMYESKPELGGWMRSNRVDVGDGQVIFEQGPRSLRPHPPNGTMTAQLVLSDHVYSYLMIKLITFGL